jgi:DNA polymerase-1
MIPHIASTICTNEDANQMYKQFQQFNPTVGAMDTETTGLHIIIDTPFLFQFGWIDEDCIRTYAVDLERQPLLGRQVVQAFRKLSQKLLCLLGHNIKFDLHMLTNFGVPFTYENMSDTMFWIRYAHSALTVDKGGPPMGLKDYAARYIYRGATTHEAKLSVERTAIAKDLNRRLVLRLGRPWTMKLLDEFFGDKLNTFDDLSTADRFHYNQWLMEDVPSCMRPKIYGRVNSEDVPYNLLNRTNVITYGHADIYLTLLIYMQTHPAVLEHKNLEAIKIENNLILPLYEMERVGFDTNLNYLERSRKKMQAYILDAGRNSRLWQDGL